MLTAGMGLALILASAVLGIVWITIALVRVLGAEIGEDAAALYVGLGLLAPLFIYALMQKLRPKDHGVAEVELLELKPHGFGDISRIAEELAVKSPLTALAVATLAGVLAARFPAALALLAQILTARRTTP